LVSILAGGLVSKIGKKGLAKQGFWKKRLGKSGINNFQALKGVITKNLWINIYFYSFFEEIRGKRYKRRQIF